MRKPRIITTSEVLAHVAAGHEVLLSIDIQGRVKACCSTQSCPWGPNTLLDLVIEL